MKGIAMDGPSSFGSGFDHCTFEDWYCKYHIQELPMRAVPEALKTTEASNHKFHFYMARALMHKREGNLAAYERDRAEYIAEAKRQAIEGIPASVPEYLRIIPESVSKP